jgi:hypothetical protein
MSKEWQAPRLPMFRHPQKQKQQTDHNNEKREGINQWRLH